MVKILTELRDISTKIDTLHDRIDQLEKLVLNYLSENFDPEEVEVN